MITVVETWRLRPELADRGLELMQEMDDLVGPGAHGDPAWVDHARFLRDPDDPAEIVMIYPWRSVDEHRQLCEREETVLRPFVDRYCAADRAIRYYEELAVEVEHDHHD